ERRLEATYGPHLEALCQRSARALTACGYTALLLHSGSLLPVFEDDQTYPFRAHAPFKVWVPLTDAPDSFLWFEPGATARLIVHRCADYWHKPAQLPQDYWVRHFDVRTVADREGARRELPADLSRAAYIGDAFAELARWGVGALNPPDLMRWLDFPRAVKSPYELDCLREASQLGGRGHRAAGRAFAARGGHHALQRRGGDGERRDERVPAARDRTPPRSRGARRRRLHALAPGRGHPSSGGPPQPAAHPGPRGGLRRDPGAGALLHPAVARCRAGRRRARALHQLAPGSGALEVGLDPGRGRALGLRPQ